MSAHPTALIKVREVLPMLRSLSSISPRIIGAGFLIVVAACGGSSGDTPAPVENVTVASVAVTLSTSQLTTGATTTASASVTSNKGTLLSDRPVSWQSSNPAIATVAGSGVTATITGVAVGSATISATSGGVTGTSGAITISAPASALTELAVT